MAATNPQELLSEAQCYICAGEVTIPQALKIALLARILLSVSPSSDTGATALQAYANCYNCFSTATLGDLMELALLDQIAQAA